MVSVWSPLWAAVDWGVREKVHIFGNLLYAARVCLDCEAPSEQYCPNNKEVNNTFVTLCVFQHTHTHKCGACKDVAHCLIGRPNSLGGQSRERGGNLAPYADIWGKIQIGPSDLLFFQRLNRLPSARLHPMPFLATWGPYTYIHVPQHKNLQYIFTGVVPNIVFI